MRSHTQRSMGLIVWAACIALALLAGAPALIARASYSPPVVKLSVEELRFGTIPVGESATRNVTIKNEGATEIRVTRFAGPAEFSTFPVVPFTIRAGASVTVVLTCTGGEPRMISDSSTFSFETPTAEKSTASLKLEATISSLKFGVAEVDFGEVEVGDTADQTVIVTNVSKRKVTLFIRKPVSESFSAGPRRETLAPGEEMLLVVKFFPDHIASYTRDVQIEDDPPEGKKKFPTVEFNLRGKGIKKVSLAPSRLDFGTVARNVIHTRTLSLTNLTDEPQPVSLGAKLDPEYFTVRPFGRMTLAPMARIDVQVQFGARGRCRHRGKLTLRDAAGMLRAAVPVSVAAR